MIQAIPQSVLKDAEFNFRQAESRLTRIERHEWWRWSIAFVIMLSLTLGLFALSIPVTGGRNWTEQTQLNASLRGLLALILLFDILVVYHQLSINKLRRDLANQLAAASTLDTLKTVANNVPHLKTRRALRTGVERRLRISTVIEGKPTSFYGRIRDISSVGLGAVIPCTLALEERVTLQFSLEEGNQGTATARVCHRRGFLYGFEFDAIEPSLSQDIDQVCGRLLTLEELRTA